jgi:nucleotide-binding universal stress UspA family protein
MHRAGTTPAQGSLRKWVDAMFRNVLVGVKGSASADQALRQAVEIATAGGGRLGLLSVAPPVGAWCSTPPFGLPYSRTQIEAELEAEARRDLERAEQTVPADVPVTKLLAHGRPADVFVTHALGGRWDLIVVGQRPRSLSWPLGRRLGERLVRSSPIPVLVVRDDPTPATAPTEPARLCPPEATSPTRIRRPSTHTAPQS